MFGGDTAFPQASGTVVPLFVSRLFQSLEISTKCAGIESALFTESDDDWSHFLFPTSLSIEREPAISRPSLSSLYVYFALRSEDRFQQKMQLFHEHHRGPALHQ